MSVDYNWTDFEQFCCRPHGLVSARANFWTVGSGAELMPTFHDRGATDFDIDLMFVHRDLVALPHRHHLDTGNPRHHTDTGIPRHHLDAGNSDERESSSYCGKKIVVIRSDQVHSGYARLQELGNAGRYLERSSLTANSCIGLSKLSFLPACCPALKLDTDVQYIPGKSHMHLNCNRFLASGNAADFMTGVDAVPCVRCPTWPEEAAEWRSRIRRHGWPTRDLIDRCVRSGCAFVAAAHRSSANAELEFRFSFSWAEVLLVRSWRPTQKYVYNTLKQIKNAVKKRLGADRFLCSYHIKTIMLWACEERPDGFWEESAVYESIRLMLGDLVERIIDRRCPHYFIRSNNLFDVDASFADSELSIADALDEIVREMNSVGGPYEEAFGHLRRDRIVSLVPRSFALLLQIPSGNPTVTSRAVMFDLADVYRALGAQKDIETAAAVRNATTDDRLLTAEMYFRRAVNRLDPTVKLSWSHHEDFFSAAERVEILDDAAELFRQPVCSSLPFSKSSPAMKEASRYNRYNSTTTTLADGRCLAGSSLDDLAHRDADISDSYDDEEHLHQMTTSGDERSTSRSCSAIDSTGICNSERNSDLLTIWRIFMPHHFSWLLSMAHLANFRYVTVRDFYAAVDICNEALQKYDNRSWHGYLYEIIYVVTLSNRWSAIFDHSLQTMLGCLTLIEYCNIGYRWTNSNGDAVCVPVCPTSLIHYVKVRSLRELDADRDLVVSALREFHQHVGCAKHVEFYLGGIDKALIFCAYRRSRRIRYDV